jgi:hypothetical protein
MKGDPRFFNPNTFRRDFKIESEDSLPRLGKKKLEANLWINLVLAAVLCAAVLSVIITFVCTPPQQPSATHDIELSYLRDLAQQGYPRFEDGRMVEAAKYARDEVSTTQPASQPVP